MSDTIINEWVYEVHPDGAKTLVAGDPSKHPKKIEASKIESIRTEMLQNPHYLPWLVVNNK